MNAKTTGKASFFKKLIFSLLSQHHPAISQSHPTTHPFIIDRANSGWGKITKFIRILAPREKGKCSDEQLFKEPSNSLLPAEEESQGLPR